VRDDKHRARPYWPPLTIDGSAIDLSHLEPLTLATTVDRRDKALQINVRFSVHCFTEAFVDGMHADALAVMDHKHKRAFSNVRYAHSIRLPALVAELPTAKVHQTPEKRNYVYSARVETDGGTIYEMYFSLKKASDQILDLELFVESAYPVETASPRLKRPHAIRFKVLALKVFENKPVRFAAR
jgi:hypothetical protein